MKTICASFALLLLSVIAHSSEIWIAYDDKEMPFNVTRDSKVNDLMERFRNRVGVNHRYDVEFKLGDMVLKSYDSMNFVMNLAKPDHPLLSAKIKEKLPTTPIKIQ